MMPLVVGRRSLAGRKDVKGRSGKDRVGQSCLRIGNGVAVEGGPARIMVGDDIDHEIERRGRFESAVAKRACELTRQRGVVVHHDCAVWAPGWRRLDEHDGSTPWLGADINQWAEPTVPAVLQQALAEAPTRRLGGRPSHDLYRARARGGDGRAPQ